MHVKIGAYEINTSEVFTSIDEAVKYVLDRHPNLEVDLVKSKVKPFIKPSNVDQSGDISKEDRPGDTGRTKADNGSTGRKPASKA
ncbi:hypothetical protein FCL53_16915 [Elizabethkingia meningoseptica]|uniref:hypothetical protein n=1 Tax=Elizabethkingia meningoseptica TaxID=238 RepID=UPI001365D12E|nr:hypothetical protein [Elizabethkingia meningoseptica]MVW93645.1 hypothetical protein [Elizabethkingia meningoseptica]